MSDGQPTSKEQLYHCGNCNKDYDFATQGAICPHQLRTEGGKDRLEPWPARSTEPKPASAHEPLSDQQAAERAASIAISAAGKHAERVVELEAEVSTLRESLAEVNRLLSLNVREVERLRSAQPPGVCECIPMAPRPYNFCQDCGGRIAPTK